MKTKQLMTRDVVYCEPSSSLNDAADLMWKHDCGSLPVVASPADRTVVGMITDRDICMAAYLRGQTLKELHVRDAMSPHPVSCHPDDELTEAEARMRHAQVRRLPVVDEQDRLVGLLSLAQIARNGDRREAGVSERDVAVTLAAICMPTLTA